VKRFFQQLLLITTITYVEAIAKALKIATLAVRPGLDCDLQDSTRQSHTQWSRMSRGHKIPSSSFGFIEALVRDFEQLLAC
jgi:hypothetical protein